MPTGAWWELDYYYYYYLCLNAELSLSCTPSWHDQPEKLHLPLLPCQSTSLCSLQFQVWNIFFNLPHDEHNIIFIAKFFTQLKHVQQSLFCVLGTAVYYSKAKLFVCTPRKLPVLDLCGWLNPCLPSHANLSFCPHSFSEQNWPADCPWMPSWGMLTWPPTWSEQRCSTICASLSRCCYEILATGRSMLPQEFATDLCKELPPEFKKYLFDWIQSSTTN